VASNISCRAGDGVWWTTSSLGMLAELSVRTGPLNQRKETRGGRASWCK